ncbi:hypothetical protein [Chroococcidiopsis sp.]
MVRGAWCMNSHRQPSTVNYQLPITNYQLQHSWGIYHVRTAANCSR